MSRQHWYIVIFTVQLYKTLIFVLVVSTINRAIHTMLYIRVMHMFLVTVVMRYCITHSGALRTSYTRQPMLGQRCHLDNPANRTTLLNIARAQCVWNCLSSDSCLVVSHNGHLNFCELSPQFCDKVVPDENFTVNAYGTERSLCLRWVPRAQYDPQTAVAFLKNPVLTPILSVGRKQDSTGLYPGKYQKTSFKIEYVANGSTFFMTNSNCEVLLVNPSCMWAWIMYTAGNELPVGAIEGGYYGNDTLYVARCKLQGTDYALGYYRPSLQLGYFAHWRAVHTKRDLEILVIMWHCNYKNTQKPCSAVGKLRLMWTTTCTK